MRVRTPHVNKQWFLCISYLLSSPSRQNMAEERWRGFQNLFLILSSLVHRCGLRGAVVHVCIDQPLHASAVLSMHPFVHASAYPLIYIRESVDLYIDVSFVCSGHPFIFPFVGPTVPPSIYASMHVLVYVLVLFYIHVWFARSPIHFLVCVSVCLFTCLSISLPVRLVMFLCLCLFVGLSPSLCLSLSPSPSLSLSLPRYSIIPLPSSIPPIFYPPTLYI